MYIARSVCKGQVLTGLTYRIIPRMPQLSERAHALYIRAHGTDRYERYSDTNATPHGARPPILFGVLKVPEFCHRPEHDVESIYWSMISALLHVRPVDDKGEPEVWEDFAEAWQVLLTHRIPKANQGYKDPRLLLLSQEETDWPKLFIGDMKGLGPLLSAISVQVRGEYALCGDGLLSDHLHEAVQRLILQYLVDHDDIPLDPHNLRRIPLPETRTVTQLSKQVTNLGSDTGTGAKRVTRGSTSGASGNKGTGSATKRKSATRHATDSDGNAGSSTSRARAPAAPDAIVVDPKRKTCSRTGRTSKRLRNNSGLPQSIDESGGSEEGEA